MSANELKEGHSPEVDLTAGGYSFVSLFHPPSAGWGVVLKWKKHRVLADATWESYVETEVMQGAACSRSEFRMELLGIVNGLKRLSEPTIVNLHTRESYILDCGKQMLRPRARYPFVANVYKGTAKNADLWNEFQSLSKKHGVRLFPIPKGHSHQDSRRAISAASDASREADARARQLMQSASVLPSI